MEVNREDAQGSCFGFEVRSPLHFEYLRRGSGDPLEVVASEPTESVESVGELLLEWRPSPRYPYHSRLYRSGSRFRVWIDTGGWFTIDPEGRRIVVPADGEAYRREERLWGLPVLLVLLARGDLPLHAAAVEVAGEAVVLAAPGRFGKTTLAAAFVRDGFRLLSEDLTCVRFGTRPSVIPGPAMLRVRRDVADRLDIPARQVGVSEDRVHFALDGETRGDCGPLPLKGIVQLIPSDAGLSLTPVPPAEAVRDLLSLSFRIGAKGDHARAFGAVTDLVRQVPVWNLSRPIRLESLTTAVDRIVADL